MRAGAIPIAAVLCATPAVAAGGDADRVAASWLVAAAAVALGAAAHWGLRRLTRRLPRWMAQHARQPVTSAIVASWQRTVAAVLLVPKLALWCAVAALISTEFMPLREACRLAAGVVAMALTSPMFILSGRSYSALTLLQLPAVLGALWLTVSGFTRLLTAHVLRATRLEHGAQDAVALLTRYALIFLGAIVVLQLWGIDPSSLTFVASVLGVGIGFGLQHLANNFVSGLVVSLGAAMVVADTHASLRFYRDLLGLTIAGESENYGTEQEHLNNVFGARVRITSLRARGGPGIELLQYLSPGDGRPFPADEHANDLIHWQTELLVSNAEDAADRLRRATVPAVSAGVVTLPDARLGFRAAETVRDPDGHVMQLIQR